MAPTRKKTPHRGVFFLVGARAFAHQWPPEADSALRIAVAIALAAALGAMAIPDEVVIRRTSSWISQLERSLLNSAATLVNSYCSDGYRCSRRCCRHNYRHRCRTNHSSRVRAPGAGAAFGVLSAEAGVRRSRRWRQGWFATTGLGQTRPPRFTHVFAPAAPSERSSNAPRLRSDLAPLRRLIAAARRTRSDGRTSR